MQCLSRGAKQPETNPVKTIDKTFAGCARMFCFQHVFAYTAILSARMLYQANSEIKQKYKMKIKYNKMNKIKIR